MSNELQQHQDAPLTVVGTFRKASGEAIARRLGDAAKTPEGRERVSRIATMMVSTVSAALAQGGAGWDRISPEEIGRATLAIVDLDLNPAAAVKEVYVYPERDALKVAVSPAGLAKLASRSGQIVHVDVVREGDTFIAGQDETGWRFSHQYVRSATNPRSERPIVCAYVITRRPEGQILSVVELDAAEIEARAKASRGGKVWEKWYAEMAKKSALHRALAQGAIIIDGGLSHALAANEHDRDTDPPAASPIVQVGAPRPPAITMSAARPLAEQTADDPSEEAPQ
jgi:recombinational DNA repair protein RecT